VSYNKIFEIILNLDSQLTQRWAISSV
jgi:hypothetical protein